MKTIPFLVAIGLGLLVSRAQAQLLVLEPDDYANMTVLNHVLPEVSLVTARADNSPIPFDVWASTSTTPFAAPTGANVFSHVGVPFWYSDRKLRMDFTGLISGISIDFQGGTQGSAEVGTLEVYNAQGALLGSYVTSGLLGGQTETMSLNRVMPDIAYAMAYTLPGPTTFGRLDHLTFSQPVPVPEPSVLWLLGVPLAGIWMARRRP